MNQCVKVPLRDYQKLKTNLFSVTGSYKKGPICGRDENGFSRYYFAEKLASPASYGKRYDYGSLEEAILYYEQSESRTSYKSLVLQALKFLKEMDEYIEKHAIVGVEK